MTDVSSRTVLYAEVQQFYAQQIQRLDNHDIEGYAATFTEDAEFAHTPGRHPARTRTGIIADLHEFYRQFENDPMQRRHWFNMINLEPQPDGSIRSTVYCLVVKIRRGARPEIAPSCVVHDVLVWVNSDLMTQSRRVEHD